MTSERVLDTQDGVDGVVGAALKAGRVALDTEFMREKTYRARLCLVQLATSQALFVIDPLAKLDISEIGGLVADPGVEVVVHAGRQDLELFHELFGALPRNVFDVQVAAGFAGYGANLPYGRLVGEVAGVRLEKGESYTDWCRRPLSRAQIKYAGDDVRHLLEIATRLKERLEELGRLEWAREEMAALEDPAAYEFAPGEAWRRVSGRGSLSGRQTAILKELAHWREESAARRDVPRGWIVRDQTLIEIARRAPSSPGALKSIRGFNAREADRSARDIFAAIERGRKAPVVESARPLPRSATVKARMVSGLADAVVRSRCERAGIATELVATRGELEALLADYFAEGKDAEGHRLLKGWRRELAGAAVLDLAQGKIAARASHRPPYVEEVEL